MPAASGDSHHIHPIQAVQRNTGRPSSPKQIQFLKIGANLTWAGPRWEERAEKQGRELVVHDSFAIWSREPAFLLNLETGTRESE
ncbi:hypothetical protein E2I00_003618 [Balaenoptera physalus]|uniref:Uncharacterized protein n=1 Tax=Balaenoptera physalus TaxID=9770 RepID=A0A643CIU5_BALPH|nr:hypothetical protein E2I00_003618 [Balaenoptera physalus]